MQRRCDTQAHGLAPGAARARQRVKGEAAPSSRRATPCKRHGAGGAAACARARDGARRMGVARLRVGATKERAQPPVCKWVNMSADETTTLAHLCATRGSWRWTRMTADTHWSQCILQTRECHACSAVGGLGAASGHAALETQVETWPALYRGREPKGENNKPAWGPPAPSVGCAWPAARARPAGLVGGHRAQRAVYRRRAAARRVARLHAPRDRGADTGRVR